MDGIFGSRSHTYAFDDQVAWLAVHTSKTAVSELMRVAWRTVGAIVARGNADADARTDRLAGLTRIGIDELPYKKGRCHGLQFRGAPRR
jgi:hypothetical protein